MALELFKPFIMKWLVDKEYTQNIKSAKRMIENEEREVFQGLEEVILNIQSCSTGLQPSQTEFSPFTCFSRR